VIQRDDNSVVPFFDQNYERVPAFGMVYGFWLCRAGGVCDLAGGDAIGEAVRL
jgi:hypothetical protein